MDALGDYDRNGEIEHADYVKWKMDFGTSVTTAGDGADGNRNGVVDAGDYTVWRNEFEPAGVGSGAIGSNVVPEPGNSGDVGRGVGRCWSGRNESRSSEEGCESRRG